MQTSVEISYYPLKEEFVPEIVHFLERLNRREGITAVTNGMSTQIFGEYDRVMEVLTSEIKESFKLPHSVFVMKIVNADLSTPS